MQASIRIGDVYALLVEFYYAQRNMEQAFRLIENMRQRGIVLAPFLDSDLINTVYRCVANPGVAGLQHAVAAATDDGVCMYVAL